MFSNLWPVVAIGLGVTLALLSSHGMIRWPWTRRAAAPSRDSREHLLNNGNDMEQRFAAALRRAPVPVRVTDGEADVEPVNGWVINRSTEGVTLELDEEGEVDPGTLLNIRPAQSGEGIPWVLVQVHGRRIVERCWHLECQYVRMPPYSIRMLFG